MHIGLTLSSPCVASARRCGVHGKLRALRRGCRRFQSKTSHPECVNILRAPPKCLKQASERPKVCYTLFNGGTKVSQALLEAATSTSTPKWLPSTTPKHASRAKCAETRHKQPSVLQRYRALLFSIIRTLYRSNFGIQSSKSSDI